MILDPFIDVVEKSADIVTSVIDRTPGFAEVKRFLVENPVVGQIVFTAIGSSLAANLANVALPSVSGMQTIGPVIGSVAFAVPGMVFKDQDFITAYVSDLTARTIATAAYFATGPGAAALSAKISTATSSVVSSFIGQTPLQMAAYQEAQRLITEPLTRLVKDSGFYQEIQRALQEAQAKLGRELKSASSDTAKDLMRQSGITPEAIARKYNVRPDVAALAINGITGVRIYSAGDPAYADFDVFGNPKAGTTGIPGAPIPDVDFAIVQDVLARLGYRLTGPLGVGSPNDPRIVAAVSDFQSKNQLPVTGKADARTLQLMRTAINLPRVAAEVRAAPRPTLSRELRAARGEPTQGVLSQLGTLAILTSPAWFAFLVLPRLRARAAAKSRSRK